VSHQAGKPKRPENSASVPLLTTTPVSVSSDLSVLATNQRAPAALPCLSHARIFSSVNAVAIYWDHRITGRWGRASAKSMRTTYRGRLFHRQAGMAEASTKSWTPRRERTSSMSPASAAGSCNRRPRPGEPNRRRLPVKNAGGELCEMLMRGRSHASYTGLRIPNALDRVV